MTRRIRTERDAFAHLSDTEPSRRSRESLHDDLERELAEIEREQELERRERQWRISRPVIDGPVVLLLVFGVALLGVAVGLLINGWRW